MTVTSTSTSADLAPGGQATFVITLWFASASGASGTYRDSSTASSDVATATISASPRGLSPRIVACHLRGKEACRRITRTRYSVSGMVPGEGAGLSARIALPKSMGNESITLDASATSPQASRPASASATVQVRKPSRPPSPSPSPSSAPTPSPTLPSSFPSVGSGPYPTSLPTLPTPIDPGSAFPTLSPNQSPVRLPSAHRARLANSSATLPLDMRLIGGQVAALALLAAAVTIAVARLSIRKPQSDSAEDPSHKD